eukprot:GHVR01003483.1.p1 GENE.GHVR01003483.1~~GHVR01003483.1.p1  ORF type:complete len:170 (-),score=10.84 GHVR01003483.1:799-1308(-)
MDDITADELRQLIDYHPFDGSFQWVESGKGRKFTRKNAGAISDSGCCIKYVKIRVKRKLYFAHRLAWLWVHGAWPEHQIDHADGDGTNNRLANLREATSRQNLANRSRIRNSQYPYKGIARSGKKWIAQFPKKYLGTFESPEAAAKEYDRAAIEAYGEFAKTNASLGLL